MYVFCTLPCGQQRRALGAPSFRVIEPVRALWQSSLAFRSVVVLPRGPNRAGRHRAHSGSLGLTGQPWYAKVLYPGTPQARIVGSSLAGDVKPVASRKTSM